VRAAGVGVAVLPRAARPLVGEATGRGWV
jgi:hypothetical protein